MKISKASLAVCFALLVVSIGISSCNDDETVSQKGVVQFVQVEGGCWKIAGDDGVDYEPINLSEEFREEGLAVQFTGQLRKDLASTCMVGQIIEIVSIRRLPESF
jgi:hypothetical protein